MSLISPGIWFAEQGWLPDGMTRAGIRRLCTQRLGELGRSFAPGKQQPREWLAALQELPLAIETDRANEQHYSLPPEYFLLVLGKHRKYSCGYWESSDTSLDEAEQRSLELVCQQAEIHDGQRILDLGCGWGSLTLWLAEQYPRAEIVGVSNSPEQRAFIEAELQRRGIRNTQIVTLDVGKQGLALLRLQPAFDRIVSIEMIEHVRNHRSLLEQIRPLIAAAGRCYFHFFSHAQFPYLFESTGRDDWMAETFFSGGMMPCRELFAQLDSDFRLVNEWHWNGEHYRRTAEGWLERHDQHRAEILTIFRRHYGAAEAKRWFHRWRIFYLAVAELFGYQAGREWGVSHVLLQPL